MDLGSFSQADLASVKHFGCLIAPSHKGDATVFPSLFPPAIIRFYVMLNGREISLLLHRIMECFGLKGP